MQKDVNDCHFAINYTIHAHPELDGGKIALMGEGYGATIALHLGLRNDYRQSILINPITDLGAMASSPDTAEWPYHIMGINYTTSSVPNDILTSAWDL